MTASPGAPCIVGNDVVDLTLPRTRGKADDARFLARILDPVERSYVDGATERDLELWCLWAAKETCYKIASKLLPDPPVFEHATFGVRWSATAPSEEVGSPLRMGSVSWRDIECTVLVHHAPGLVHAVGHALSTPAPDHHIEMAVEELDAPDTPWGGDEETLLGRLTPREADAVHSRASAAVRLGARRALADALAVEEARLELVCAPGTPGRRPPSVLLDGRNAPVGVSLSHDGAWIAWALSLPGQNANGL